MPTNNPRPASPEEIEEQMRLLLSEAESGAIGWRARLDAAMELVAAGWDSGVRFQQRRTTRSGLLPPARRPAAS